MKLQENPSQQKDVSKRFNGCKISSNHQIKMFSFEIIFNMDFQVKNNTDKDFGT